MYEIRNKVRTPIPLVLKSKSSANFTTKIVPGVGAGQNVIYVDDELMTDVVFRIERQFKMIATRHIPNRS